MGKRTEIKQRRAKYEEHRDDCGFQSSSGFIPDENSFTLVVEDFFFIDFLLYRLRFPDINTKYQLQQGSSCGKKHRSSDCLIACSFNKGSFHKCSSLVPRPSVTMQLVSLTSNCAVRTLMF